MDPKNLGKKKRLGRVELDLTHTQLAEKINAKQKSTFRYETGASLPSMKTVVKIATVLKKPAGYFLDDWGEQGGLARLKKGFVPIKRFS